MEIQTPAQILIKYSKSKFNIPFFNFAFTKLLVVFPLKYASSPFYLTP